MSIIIKLCECVFVFVCNVLVYYIVCMASHVENYAPCLLKPR